MLPCTRTFHLLQSTSKLPRSLLHWHNGLKIHDAWILPCQSRGRCCSWSLQCRSSPRIHKIPILLRFLPCCCWTLHCSMSRYWRWRLRDLARGRAWSAQCRDYRLLCAFCRSHGDEFCPEYGEHYLIELSLVDIASVLPADGLDRCGLKFKKTYEWTTAYDAWQEYHWRGAKVGEFQSAQLSHELKGEGRAVHEILVLPWD